MGPVMSTVTVPMRLEAGRLKIKPEGEDIQEISRGRKIGKGP
jgi:hypothetical protein